MRQLWKSLYFRLKLQLYEKHLHTTFSNLSLSFTGFSQNGLDFDGVNDYVQTTYSGISGSSARTVEARINTTANCNPTNGGTQNIITDWGVQTTRGRFTFAFFGQMQSDWRFLGMVSQEQFP